MSTDASIRDTTAAPPTDWASPALIGSGLLMLVMIGLALSAELTGWDPPGWFFAVVTGVFGATLLGAAMGLLGLYPANRGRTPWLTVPAAGLAALASVSGLVLVGVALTGRPPWELSDGFYIVVIFGGGVGLLLSSLLSGIATLVAAPLPRSVGVFLIAAVLPFVALLAVGLLGREPGEWVPPILFGVWAVAYLAAGIGVRQAAAPRLA
jgi:hypothetical protein